MEIITKSAQETYELGKKIGSGLKNGEVFALEGNLGSGKTTFIQGLGEGLGIKTKIISPTFILMRKYGNLYHVDLYRLEENVEAEVINLGLADIWQDDRNIVVIEWAEKIKDMLPPASKWIKFENLGENRRRITIQ